jgi:predicted ATP-grasp superfamily ATP-dependent carboligase
VDVNRLPIAVLYEHPEWFRPLFAELERRQVPYRKLCAAELWYDPAVRRCPYSLIVNRVSAYPSKDSHPEIILFVKQYLAYLEGIHANVVNGYSSFMVATSKAMQLAILEQLGLRYPRARVIHHLDQVLGATEGLAFPIVVKPNIGGSGAGIVRFDSLDELESAVLGRVLDLGIDHTALIQEYLVPRDHHIVRVEILDGDFLYAIRLPIVEHSFNYCPADGCNVGVPSLSAASVSPPPEVIRDVARILEASQADLGSVEYRVSRSDGRVYYYDINPLSNFVADARRVIGFDPVERLVDYIVGKAS